MKKVLKWHVDNAHLSQVCTSLQLEGCKIPSIQAEGWKSYPLVGVGVGVGVGMGVGVGGFLCVCVCVRA